MRPEWSNLGKVERRTFDIPLNRVDILDKSPSSHFYFPIYKGTFVFDGSFEITFSIRNIFFLNIFMDKNLPIFFLIGSSLPVII